MNAYNSETMSLAVTQAANEIRAIIAKGGEAAIRGTPEQSAAMGEIIDQAVALAGGPPAFFTLLAHEVSFGDRILRSLHRAYLRYQLISEAALFIFDLLAGDPDYMSIGRKVDETIKACGGDEEPVLNGLSNKLQISSRSLEEYRDAYRVAKLGGKALADLLPCGCPPSFLAPLSRILTETVAWRRQEAILKAVKEILRLKVQGRDAQSIVAKVIAESGKVRQLPIVPAWHHPPASASAQAA